MTRTYWRQGGLAVLVTAAAIGLAACSGGSGNPRVASLGKSSSSGSGSSAATGSSATSGATGNVTQLMGEWTACMRSHGDPNQVTPTIDANKDIHVITPAGYKGPMGLFGKTGTNSCTVYISEASQALGGGSDGVPKNPNPDAMLKFAECMRANGVADFADPASNGQLSVPADSNTPMYRNAQKICAAKTGLPKFAGGGVPPPGHIFNG